MSRKGALLSDSSVRNFDCIITQPDYRCDFDLLGKLMG